MRQEKMWCGQCRRVVMMDLLQAEDLARLKEHTGIFLSAPEGWTHAASHCPNCHLVVVSLVSEPTLPVPLRWFPLTPLPEGHRRVFVDQFRTVWSQLAALGFCDAVDGQEYKRVLGEWAAANFPSNKAVFIVTNANRPAAPPP